VPQTDTGLLLFIGAIFLLIGLLGGGFEISAITIPPVGKLPRILSVGIGVILMVIAINRLIFPSLSLQSSVTPTLEGGPISPTNTPVPEPANIPITATRPAQTETVPPIIFSEWRDVPASELGNPPPDDVGARFRATNDYAAKNGFVGGFPNFHEADYGQGTVYDTILIK